MTRRRSASGNGSGGSDGAVILVPLRSRSINRQHSATNPLPILLVAACLRRLRDRRDECVHDGVLVVGIEADSRTPTKAESWSAERTHRLGGLGIQADLAY